MPTKLPRKVHLLLALIIPASALAEPVWIWTKRNAEDNEQADFKTEFEIAGAVKSATLKLTCDNGATALINGKKVLENPDWMQPTKTDVKADIKAGKNEILVQARNHGGSAALIAVLLTSGYTEHAPANDGQPTNSVEILTKPYRKNELKDKLRLLLGQRENP